jgi:hypothetical protein
MATRGTWIGYPEVIQQPRKESFELDLLPLAL